MMAQGSFYGGCIVSERRERQFTMSTFIVRFWREAGVEHTRWRGQAQCVQAGEHVDFSDEAALLTFIRRWVQMSDEDSA